MRAELPSSTHLLIFPHIRVQNANAISSPLTHGFPSITAFIGFMWALERKTCSIGLDIMFNAVGVVCHDFQEQVADSGFTHIFNQTRNPIEKDGKTAPIIEEGRIHLDISLLFGVYYKERKDSDEIEEDLKKIAALVQNMRIAGGSILPPSQAMVKRYSPYYMEWHSSSDENKEFRQICYRLLPGYALVERPGLISDRLKSMQEVEPKTTALEAWLSLSGVNWRCKNENIEQESNKKHTAEWQHDRDNGWIVPIPVGYGAIGKEQAAGSVPSARDNSIQFQSVESLFSIGEWIAPFHLKNPNELLWYAFPTQEKESLSEKTVYRCYNFYCPDS